MLGEYMLAHNGYQSWHREYDNNLTNWLNMNPNATPKQFLQKLNSIYKTRDMVQRFGPVKF